MKKLTLLLGLLSSFLLADIKFETSQLEELREIVERPHKKIFIFVSSNNCTYCKKQKELILSNSDLSSKLNQYDAFHVNKDEEEEGSITVAVTPAIIIFNERNEEIVRYYGFQNESELSELLDSNLNEDLLDE